MKRTLKRALMHFFRSKPDLNKRALQCKRSYDEVCRIIDRLACGQSCGKKKK